MFYPRDPLINLIPMRMAGHASASGYDRLADYFDAFVFHPVSNWTFGKRAIARSFRFFINRSDSVWYHRNSFIAEFYAAFKWIQTSGQIFHFLYGENTHRYLGALKSTGRKNYIVCTYHTPPDKFCQVVHNHKHLSRLDAIIVVSTVQSGFFSELVGSQKVFYVPHGIDVNYFKPMAGPKKDSGVFRVLFVGTHLRDFETLVQSARFLKSRANELRFSIVTSPKFHHIFQGLENIELCSGISDEKLLNLYQDSDLFVLPLLDGTANNSLLEAMACGLPIVSTDLPGIRDYVNDVCAQLAAPRDPNALTERILYLKDNESVRKKMAHASRNRSQEFSWPKIAAKIREVYEIVRS